MDSAELANLRGQLAALGKAHAVIECQPDGTILTANENFLRLTGYELAELQGQQHGLLAGGAEAHLWDKLSRGRVRGQPLPALRQGRG